MCYTVPADPWKRLLFELTQLGISFRCVGRALLIVTGLRPSVDYFETPPNARLIFPKDGKVTVFHTK